jgi:CheY-like chemotaxis protein
MPLRNKIVVLVVEDEPLIRMNIVDELEAAGFEVYEANNTPTALELLTSNPSIEVMFTDVDMPGGPDGLVLAAAVRDRWPPIKIIVTSGYRKVIAADMPLGSRFLPKPVTPHLVSNSIREMCGVL